ncbi:MAG TPA: GntR family transcriptional regulator [Chthoniobacterales bacterium]
MISLIEAAMDRPNVPQVLAAALREAIIDGRLLPGKRINEVHLARELGVSRTPLREALMRLTAEGTVKTIPRRGFFVHSLSVEEFQKVYAIRAILDPEALKLAGIPPASHLDELERLNRKFGKAKGVARRIVLDNAWHLQLLAVCPNDVLLDLIKQFMARTRRYELALLRERSRVQTSVAEHRKIIASLRAGNLTRACAALRQNMQSGQLPIIKQLKARELTEGITKRGKPAPVKGRAVRQKNQQAAT